MGKYDSHSKKNTFYHEQVQTESNLPVRFTVYEESDTFVPRHWHTDLEIVYIIDGSMFIEEGEKSRLLQKDDFVIFNSEDIHSTRCNGKTRVLLLQFPFSYVKEHIPDFETIRFEGYEEPFQDPADSEIRKLLLNLAQIYEKKSLDGYILAIQGYLYFLLFLLVRDYKVKVAPQIQQKTQKNLQRLSSIIKYTQDHYQMPISIHEAAGHIHMSDEYFCRYFKQYMKMTYFEYLSYIRISHIYSDLISTDLPIAQLLEIHGFQNYKVFSRMFKSMYGQTPLKIRKEYLNKSGTYSAHL